MARKYSNSAKGNHDFSTVPEANIKRSTFDRSHGHKTTFDASILVPIYVDEALPGDTFKLSMTAFARTATPIKPVMDNIILESFFFAVPNRLLWDNWEKFCGYQENPGDSTDFTIPTLTAQQNGTIEVETGDTLDYMGIPLGFPISDPAGSGLSALPVRAYWKIWNEWFRDENFFDSIPIDTSDTATDITSYIKPLVRGKRKDYFTGCLPWPQKGEAVDLPLGTSAPVVPTGDFIPQYDNGGAVTPYSGGTGGSTGIVVHGGADGGNFKWDDPKLEADLSNAIAPTINSLREAFQTQRLLERDARGGTRYTEVIRAHFNVTSPDFRLQRPEYLGGGRSYISYSAVAQTTPGNAGDIAITAQGNLAAFGTGAATGHGFTHSFTEHMTIIGMVMARADLTYQQGINRMWSRSTRYDFFWPALAHLGEQEVLSKEIFADGSAGDEDVFGYQERYAEYRYKPSQISGLFRSTANQSLDIWHLAQEFDTRPVLNDLFIEENVPMDRINAVGSEPDFIMDTQINLRCVRPMPVYGIPGYVDHF